LERYAVPSEFEGFMRVYYRLEDALNALSSADRERWKQVVKVRTDRGYRTVAEVEAPQRKRRWFR